MKIEIELSDDVIHDGINTAPSLYWGRDLKWEGKLELTLVEHDGNWRTGEELARHVVTEDKIRVGIAKLATLDHRKGGFHFSDMLNPYARDGWTWDAVLQMAVFGELKYG